jgi:hypothetical protein
MRRIAWLLLVVVCTMFVQVQPLESAKPKPCACRHCKAPGTCGMPDCGQVPGTACQALAAGETARAAVADASRARPSRVAKAGTFLWPARQAVLPSPLIAETFAGHAARVPLFKAHCSFLL